MPFLRRFSKGLLKLYHVTIFKDLATIDSKMAAIIRYFVTTIEKLCCIVFQKQTLSDTQKIIYFENSQENMHGCAKF